MFLCAGECCSIVEAPRAGRALHSKPRIDTTEWTRRQSWLLESEVGSWCGARGRMERTGKANTQVLIMLVLTHSSTTTVTFSANNSLHLCSPG